LPEEDLTELVIIGLLVKTEAFKFVLEADQVLLVEDVRQVMAQDLNKVAGFYHAGLSRVELLEFRQQ